MGIGDFGVIVGINAAIVGVLFAALLSVLSRSTQLRTAAIRRRLDELEKSNREGTCVRAGFLNAVESLALGAAVHSSLIARLLHTDARLPGLRAGLKGVEMATNRRVQEVVLVAANTDEARWHSAAQQLIQFRGDPGTISVMDALLAARSDPELVTVRDELSRRLAVALQIGEEDTQLQLLSRDSRPMPKPDR